jgi:hypothetical protein
MRETSESYQVQSPALRKSVCSTCVQSLLGHRERQEIAILETLRYYERELQLLRDENAELRRSAQVFGELAERLNFALRMAVSDEATANESCAVAAD